MWRQGQAMKRSCGPGTDEPDEIESGCLILVRFDPSQTEVFCRHLCPTCRAVANRVHQGLAFFSALPIESLALDGGEC